MARVERNASADHNPDRAQKEKYFLSVPRYAQGDPRWGSISFDNPGDEEDGTTMDSSGCGPSALAAVLSYRKCKEILPPEVAKKVIDNGWRLRNDGTVWDALTGIPKLYGLKSKQVSWEEAKEALNRGIPVIQSHGKGYFTQEGHIIVLTEIHKEGPHKGEYKVVDSRTENYRTHATESQITSSLNKDEETGIDANWIIY